MGTGAAGGGLASSAGVGSGIETERELGEKEAAELLGELQCGFAFVSSFSCQRARLASIDDGPYIPFLPLDCAATVGAGLCRIPN